MRPSLALYTVLLAACADPGPPLVPTPPATCGGARLAPLTLVAGGRADIVLDAALSAELVAVTATSGVEVWRDADRVIVRAGYTEASATITAACTHGRIEVPVAVEALSMRALLRWDESSLDAPPAREYFAWWMDPRGERSLYLYGGFVYRPVQFTPSTDAFRLDLRTLVWSRVTTSGEAPPPGGRVATRGEAMLYFGGATLAREGNLETPSVLREVRGEGDALAFGGAAFETSAVGSYTGAFVRDAARDRWLSVCGVDTRALGLHCRVHVYTADAGFTELEVAGDPPPGRYGFHYALDPASDRVIVFAGQVGVGELDIARDTWALELAPPGGGGPRWVQLFESAEGIAPRRNGAYALDPEGRRFFVWGGTADGRTATPGLDVLELDRGRERWVHVDLPEDIPPRASGAGLLDAAGDRILWGFGNAARLYTDLYELALAPADEI